ncbi:hypothetical protein Pla86_47710 [Planctomycetes bacterium Pla86]|uniref:Uncharacterized protein n=1 Tax=Engelhardtia mirabilis TaxID=2528011 RepID=A0A518BRP6_9BACT|nr:hypothetical protein Pla133_47730 [Planctomycetes bacterium Pla133]QDV03978.1 hypothetical protein Pla86_47710 [Planctomycetes bacterium Pla86]
MALMQSGLAMQFEQRSRQSVVENQHREPGDDESGRECQGAATHSNHLRRDRGGRFFSAC